MLFGCVLFLIFFLSCESRTESVMQRPTESDGVPEPVSDLPWQKLEKLHSETGFEIPCLVDAKVKREISPLKSQPGRSTVFVIEYAPEDCIQDDLGVFQKLVGGAKYQRDVISILGYQTEKSIFAYTVSFAIRKTNATNELTYLDTNGDGTLDTVFQSTSLAKPILPKWLAKAPN